MLSCEKSKIVWNDTILYSLLDFQALGFRKCLILGFPLVIFGHRWGFWIEESNKGCQKSKCCSNCSVSQTPLSKAAEHDLWRSTKTDSHDPGKQEDKPFYIFIYIKINFCKWLKSKFVFWSYLWCFLDWKKRIIGQYCVKACLQHWESKTCTNKNEEGGYISVSFTFWNWRENNLESIWLCWFITLYWTSSTDTKVKASVTPDKNRRLVVKKKVKEGKS